MKLSPFFVYYGGKWRAAPRYPAPTQGTIIEPFAGAAGYSVRHHTRNVVLVEKDFRIAALWAYLIGVSGAEIRRLPEITSGQSVDDFPLQPEAKTLIGFWLNKGAASPCKTPSAWMRSGVRPNSYWGGTIRDRIASQVDEIRHWKILQGDYTTAPDLRATWFIDPPYAEAGNHYKHSLAKTGYDALGHWCRERNGQVIVCENEGATWLPFTFAMQAKATPGRSRIGYSSEVMWVGSQEEKPNEGLQAAIRANAEARERLAAVLGRIDDL